MARKTKAVLEKELESTRGFQSELKKANEDLYKSNESLRREIKQLKANNIDLEFDSNINLKEIDFGIGKIYYKIDPSSTLVVNDLINALQEQANVTPIMDIIKAIKRSSRF